MVFIHKMFFAAPFAALLSFDAYAAEEDARLNSAAEAPMSAPHSDVTIGVRAGTDLMFKGISQMNSNFSPFYGYVDAYRGPFYIGGDWFKTDWDIYDPVSSVADVWAGYRPQIGDVQLDFRVSYAHHEPSSAPNWFQYSVAAGTALPYDINAKLGYIYGPEWSGTAADEHVFYLTLDKKINDKWLVSGGVANNIWRKQDLGDFWDWNFGVAYNVTPELRADLRYFDSDIANSACAMPDACSGRLVFSMNYDWSLSKFRQASR